MNIKQYNNPESIETEEAVLGAILLERLAQILAFGLIKSNAMFASNRHQAIFQACKNLFEENNPVDLITVVSELRRLGELGNVGGAHYITELTCKVSSSAHIESHIRILQELFVRRAIIYASEKNKALAVDDSTDPFVLLERWQRQLLAVTEELSSRKASTAREVLRDSLKNIADAINRGGISGIATGWTGFDKTLGGWKKGKLYIIAGRPGMGKSAMAVVISKNVSFIGKSVKLFSLEMTNGEIMARLISNVSGIPYNKLDNGRISNDDLFRANECVGSIANASLSLDDTPKLSVAELRAKCFMAKAEGQLDLIIIDYLQIMEGEGFNREQQVANISSNLKALSKELDVPVIALAQLSRAVEGRGGDKKPQLSDLRESGSIEQDADIVIFPWRPEYYGIASIDLGDGSGEISTHNLMINIVAKHRGGPCGSILNYCNIGLNRIEDYGYKEQLSIPEINPESFDWNERPAEF
jgi:replicative DNA helicase